MDATITLKRAFGIDEVLLTIYGFLVGNDMNSNAKMMKVRLVSSRFNKFFLSCMRSTPLHLAYTAFPVGPSREVPIVRWLKSYDIATLFKLVVNIVGQHIPTFCKDFDGLNMSNLEVLDLSIFKTYGVRSKVQDLFHCFAQVTSLKSLELCNDRYVSATLYNDFLSYFPVLNSLEITLGNNYDRTTHTLEYPKRLEHLVHHELHGNVSFRSESVKTLEVSRKSSLGSISSIDCPSLEQIICGTRMNDPSVIAGISSNTLVERFGITDKHFIADYLESNTHHIPNLILDESITSISFVPMNYITGRNTPFKVSPDCVIVLFAINNEIESDDYDYEEEDY